MTLLDNRLFYTLDEVSTRWGITQNDLLQLAAKGKMRLAFQQFPF